MTGGRRSPVLLVGAGPGDPDLLTLRAADELARAEVVVADDALAGLVAGCAPRAQVMMVDPAVDPEVVAAALARAAAEGQRTVRLYRGDPWTHPGHHDERAGLERRGVPVEGVPGLVTELALAAVDGLAATARPVASVVRIGPAAAGASPRAGVNDLWLAAGGLSARVAGVGAVSR